MVTRPVFLDVDATVAGVAVMPGGQLMFDPGPTAGWSPGQRGRPGPAGDAPVVGGGHPPAGVHRRPRAVLRRRRHGRGRPRYRPLGDGGRPGRRRRRRQAGLDPGGRAILKAGADQDRPAGRPRPGGGPGTSWPSPHDQPGLRRQHRRLRHRHRQGGQRPHCHPVGAAPQRPPQRQGGRRRRRLTAEVLNLTRNVHIEGTPKGRSHIFVRSSSPSPSSRPPSATWARASRTASSASSCSAATRCTSTCATTARAAPWSRGWSSATPAATPSCPTCPTGSPSGTASATTPTRTPTGGTAPPTPGPRATPATTSSTSAASPPWSSTTRPTAVTG